MTETTADSSHGRPPGEKQHRGLFSRIALFLRQVIAELRKVVTPTRSQWINYTAVVLVFVTVMMLIISGLDYVFFTLAKWVFVGPTEQ